MMMGSSAEKGKKASARVDSSSPPKKPVMKSRPLPKPMSKILFNSKKFEFTKNGAKELNLNLHQIDE